MIFFVLGRNPALSVAEITNVERKLLDEKKDKVILGKDFILIDDNIDGPDLLEKLGGFVKCGKIAAQISADRGVELSKKIIEHVKRMAKKGEIKKDKKFLFGISSLGKIMKKKVIKNIAMDLKGELKELGINSRWVTSKEDNLSSVVVEKNNLFKGKNGIDIVFIFFKDTIYIGETSAVQKFEEYSKLDYGRPLRDAHSGMLPPKLAKMMINISGAKKDEVILDPFCGSGTILQESLLLGYKNIIGSDFKKESMEACNSNIKWLKEKVPEIAERRDLKLLNCSAEKVSNYIPQNSVGAIVAEPYLGPPIRPGVEYNFTEIIKTLSKLYLKSFRQFKEVLKNGGVVVMVLPIFKASGGKGYYRFMPIISEIEEMGFLKVRVVAKDVMDEARQIYGKEAISKRETLIYSRPGQYIIREIVKFRKK